jgi:hypothetical protein
VDAKQPNGTPQQAKQPKNGEQYGADGEIF